MATTRINEIDLVRFIAALAVVFFHFTFRGYAADHMTIMPYPWLTSASKYGYLGVELFFMISGFVILMSAANGSLRDFVISRVVRLYPAFWACCTITFLATLAIGGSSYFASLSQYLVNMTMLSGFIGVPSIDGAYWSLFVELRFYVLVVIILMMGRIHQAQTFILLWLIASVALEVVQIGKLRYLLITDYSSFFIAGATYFIILSKGMTLSRVSIILISWCLSIFQSIHNLREFENHYNTTISAVIVATIITAFFALMMLISLRRTGIFGRTNWYLLGVLTYPLYLLHQNIGFMIFNIAYPVVNVHILLWSTVFLFLTSAYAIHIFIEKPFAPKLKNALNTFADNLHREIGRLNRTL